MILMQFEIHSKVLQMDTDVWCLVPGNEAGFGTPKAVDRWKVLWLLHGGVGDHTFWLRHTNIEQIAGKHQDVAVILPDAYGSSCVDTYSGTRYGTYLSQELPQIMRTLLPKLSDKREDNWISGFSNGGYGSLYLGFTFPEVYGAVGAFGAGDKADADLSGNPKEKIRLFGEGDLHNTEYSVSYLAVQTGLSDGIKPRVIHGCGENDPWRDMNEKVRDAILSVPGDPYQYEFRIWEGEGHTSSCCNKVIEYFLDQVNRE